MAWTRGDSPLRRNVWGRAAPPTWEAWVQLAWRLRAEPETRDARAGATLGRLYLEWPGDPVLGPSYWTAGNPLGCGKEVTGGG